MASHPAMLLDPKGAKRQTQRNGNHPDSHFPANGLSPKDSTNMPCEPPTDLVHSLNHSSNLLTLPGSPGFPSPQILLSSMNSSVMDGEVLTEAKGLKPTFSQTSLQVPSAEAISSDLDQELVSQMKSGELNPGNLSAKLPASVDFPAHSDIQGNPVTICADQSDPNLAFAPSTMQIDPLDVSAKSIDAVSNTPSHDLFITDPPPAMDPMLTEEPENLGLLLDGTGKQNRIRSIPVSPMAPAGTAAATNFQDPILRTPNTVNSTTMSPAVKQSPQMSVQFSNVQDDDPESDAKRSHHEVSDDEDHFDRRNLITDVYGVEARKNQLVKRIKTADDDSSSANTPASISGSSGLGKWMKENHQDKQTPVPVVSEMVDLTTGMSSPPLCGIIHVLI